MKLRCPHCGRVFEQLSQAACPSCGKGLRFHGPRLGDRSWRSLRARAPGTRRRAPEKSSPLLLPMVLFSYRSRFFFMALILAAVIAGKLMLTKVDPGQVMLPGQSKVRQTQRELTVLRTALEWFRANCNRYPSDAEGLRALVRNPGIPGWQGHYIDGLPPDVWGHPFQYACSNNAVRLFSLGPDGAAGTPDDIPSPFPNFRELMQRINVNELPRADAPENGPAAGGP